MPYFSEKWLHELNPAEGRAIESIIMGYLEKGEDPNQVLQSISPDYIGWKRIGDVHYVIKRVTGGKLAGSELGRTEEGVIITDKIENKTDEEELYIPVFRQQGSYTP